MPDDLIGKFLRPTPVAPDQSKVRGDGAPDRSGDGREYSPRPFMLDLMTVDGARHAFPYAHLLRIHYEPASGIELFFATHTVTIRGRSLDALYEELIAHAVPRVIAAGERYDLGERGNGDTQPFVHTINVQKPGALDEAD